MFTQMSINKFNLLQFFETLLLLYMRKLNQ